MKFYLSGPMRPHDDYNFPLFEKVSTRLRADGMEIVSPHEYGDSKTDTRGKLMGEDIRLIIDECDGGVVCLPGWETSPGAAAEVAVAFATERAVLDYVPDDLNLLGYRLEPSKTVSVTVPREEQYKTGTPLIGLCGFAQSGKDTVAQFLVKERGWTRVAFADALRDVLYALNPIVHFEPGRIEMKSYDNPIPYRQYRIQELVELIGWDRSKTEVQEVRELLQRLGTEAGREIIDQNLWVRLGEDKVESAGTPVVITDCRFPNEVNMVKRRNGHLIWIDRPGVGAANAHASEHSVGPADCAAILKNDGTIKELYERVGNIENDLNRP